MSDFLGFIISIFMMGLPKQKEFKSVMIFLSIIIFLILLNSDL
jgi:hypothetical protein